MKIVFGSSAKEKCGVKGSEPLQMCWTNHEGEASASGEMNVESGIDFKQGNNAFPTAKVEGCMLVQPWKF